MSIRYGGPAQKKKTTRKILRKRAELYNCVKQTLLSHCSQGLKQVYTFYEIEYTQKMGMINDKVISLIDAVEN